MSESTTTDISGITADQKIAILQDAIVPWSGIVRNIDTLPDAGPLSVVWASGYNTAIQLIQARFGATDSVMVSGAGTLSEDFAANFATMVQGVTPDSLAALQSQPISTLADPAAAAAATAEQVVTDEAAAATGTSTVSSGSSALTQGEVSNTTTAAAPDPSDSITGAAAPVPTTGGAASPTGGTTTAPLPSAAPTA